MFSLTHSHVDVVLMANLSATVWDVGIKSVSMEQKRKAEEKVSSSATFRRRAPVAQVVYARFPLLKLCHKRASTVFPQTQSNISNSARPNALGPELQQRRPRRVVLKANGVVLRGKNRGGLLGIRGKEGDKVGVVICGDGLGSEPSNGGSQFVLGRRENHRFPDRSVGKLLLGESLSEVERNEDVACRRSDRRGERDALVEGECSRDEGGLSGDDVVDAERLESGEGGGGS